MENCFLKLITIISICCFSFSAFSRASNEANAFVGTWRLMSVTRDTVPKSHRTNSFGEHPTGYLNYSADGHMIVIIVQGNRSAPIGKIATSAEAVALYRSMNSYAGTYTVLKDQIIHHIQVSWNQKWTGSNQVRFYKLEGKDLILSLPPTRDPQTGQTVIDSLTWEKV